MNILQQVLNGKNTLRMVIKKEQFGTSTPQEIFVL